ncbi:MAG: hypothetical protein IPL27_10000 [Lewinellaceae bacterium]|nr:hypothetical protein [Lewinellaceae bacterium]
MTDKIYNLLLKLEKYETTIDSLKKHKSFIKVVILSLFIAFVSYLYIAILNKGNFIFDKRDYHIYRTLKKNGYEFMIDNLSYDTKDSASWCYGSEPKNCNKFGKLYNLQSATKSCLELGKGWRLPTDE